MNKSMQAALVLSVMLVATLAVAIVADGTDADSGIPDDAANPEMQAQFAQSVEQSTRVLSMQ